MKPLRFVIAAGGTGGHIYPALAIGEALRLRHPECRILYVGTNRGLEKKVIPAGGFELKTIVMSGIVRSWAPMDILKNLIAPFKALIGFLQSFWIVIRFRPDAVIGCGGYVTGPVVLIAHWFGKPTILQEQNSRPGRTTVALSRWVDQVHIAYEEAGAFIRRKHIVHVSGNPLRQGLLRIPRAEASARWKLDVAMPVLLILGGSLGARSINLAMIDIYHELMAATRAQIIWQCGSADYNKLEAKIKDHTEDLRLFPFIDDMSAAYSCADLVLCRAGAMTLSELTWMGVPAVLVPYPYAADNHQEYNAQSLVRRGAAVMLLNHELQTKLKYVLTDLLNRPEQLKNMAANSLQLRQPDAARRMADSILNLVRRSN